jgi:hypothetical protein
MFHIVSLDKGCRKRIFESLMAEKEIPSLCTGRQGLRLAMTMEGNA